MSEKIEKIRERVLKHHSKQPALFISRIPKNTFIEFKKLASDLNFCKDYGMALKWLIDNNKLYMKLLEIEERLTNLEKIKEKEETVKTLDGRIVRGE